MKKSITRTIMETSFKVTAVNAETREFFERTFTAFDIDKANVETTAKEMLAINDSGAILIKVSDVSFMPVKFGMEMSEFIANAKRV